jgi:putative membrane protein
MFMIKQQVLVFILRWIISSVAMWLCIELFGTVSSDPSSFWLYLTAGLIFSLINSIVKPLATILALPLIILSMWIFTILLNVAMVALAIWLLPDVQMDFWGIFWSTIIISLINSLVNLLVPGYNKK